MTWGAFDLCFLAGQQENILQPSKKRKIEGTKQTLKREHSVTKFLRGKREKRKGNTVERYFIVSWKKGLKIFMKSVICVHCTILLMSGIWLLKGAMPMETRCLHHPLSREATHGVSISVAPGKSQILAFIDCGKGEDRGVQLIYIFFMFLLSSRK